MFHMYLFAHYLSQFPLHPSESVRKDSRAEHMDPSRQQKPHNNPPSQMYSNNDIRQKTIPQVSEGWQLCKLLVEHPNPLFFFFFFFSSPFCSSFLSLQSQKGPLREPKLRGCPP